MSAGEVLVGEPSAVKRPRASLVGATVRAAEIRQKAKISVVECHDGQLQAAAAALEFVAGVVNDREDISEVEQALASLFRLLFECSECCFGVGEETARDLRIATEYTSKEARWLEPEIATRLRVAIGFLEQAIVNGNSKEKADSLLNIIGRQNGHWVLAVRSPRSADSIRKGLESLGADIPVVPIASLSADQEYGGIIVPGWPNDQRFTRLRSLAIAPDIQILAYPFERKWVLRHQLRERTRQQTERLTAEQRSTIVGVSTGFLTSFDTAAEDAREPTEISLDLPVFQLEERLSQRLRHPSIAKPGEEAREAQCVQFFGGSYALLTEWAALPLINDLIDTRVGDKAKLVSATASQLKMGDFVLFRAGGDKEFTRLIAEEMLGVETYRGLREIAERWKVAIRRLGSSPAIVQRRLSDYGLDRTLPTVAGWCGDPSRIGPGELTDIDVIAKAAKDKELEATGDEVKEAISRVRGAHNSAGLRLTKLILGEIHDRIDQLGERPTLLDLSYGQAWVVQVGSVEPKRQPYPANQVNRLLWSADNAM
jgi:hypothetical protein